MQNQPQPQTSNERVELILLERNVYGDISLRRVRLTELQGYIKRVVLLNAPVVKPNLFVWVQAADWGTVRAIIDVATRKGIQIMSFIGHESTAKLLSEQLGISIQVNRGMYTPDADDLALVFRLRGRPAKEVTTVSPGDFEIFYVHYFA